jgi:hypothetical protein
MKIFVLEINKGQYDDEVNWTEGVFSTIEKLEEYKQKYVENIERIKQLPCPIDQEIYDQPEWYYIVSDEDWELVNEWETKVNNAKEINNYRTIELELDPEFKEE